MLSGRKRLADWIDRSKCNQREAAGILGVHPVVLSEWLSGSKTPGLANALSLERITGIAVDSWLLTDVSADDDDEAVGTRKRKSASR